MLMEISISSIDAARDQLEEAIAMLFQKRSPIATHTLASAARGILIGLTKHTDVMSMSKYIEKFIPKVERKATIDAWHEAQNFFKHSRHKSKTLTFNSEDTEIFILDACLMYMCFTKKSFNSLNLFYVYMQSKYPDIPILPDHIAQQIGDMNLDKDKCAEIFQKQFTKNQDDIFDLPINMGQ
ncbi:MAG: hypothetical protein GX410_03885 [Elusimicrobia bacterium]|nr:hypothetical protein [Elusimicrobiota bacterium]